MPKKEDLAEIVKCCERRFNRGSASEWKHTDFGDLSREIQLDTDVVVSSNTLKRIFGKISVDDDYYPQQATLDALKKYGSYQTHRNETEDVNEREQKVNIQKLPPPRRRLVFILATCLPLIVVVVVLLFGSKAGKSSSAAISLSSTEGILPATAHFKLILPNVDDSLFVNFGDKSRMVYVSPGKQVVAHVYLIPGVFKVSLQTKEKELASTKVSVHSNKWIGLGFHRQADIPLHYYAFPAERTAGDSSFHITNEQLAKTGLDTTAPFLTRLSNFTPQKGVSDNFVFETVFKNQLSEKGLYCNGTQFQITGIDRVIRFKFVNSGCSIGVLNILSETVYDGTKTNQSRFVINLNQWNTVKLINRNKHVTLWVNGRELFSGDYKISVGEIQGVWLEFDRNGYVKSCDLTSLDGKLLYHF